eukprot:5889015-Pleurochrysis_carterae.AAC.1
MLNAGANEPKKLVGSLHSENAGEFLSTQFADFLAKANVHSSTSPSHVYEIDGVFKRAIRFIMELARSSLVAAFAPTGYWDYAVHHAVDILNRTSTPPGGDKFSFELVTGSTPSIMGIIPFGCRAFAVKPRIAVSKTRIDSRAWVAINLRQSPQSPGTFNVLVPGVRTVVTSDVYFDETLFLWRSMPTRPTAIDAAVVPP